MIFLGILEACNGRFAWEIIPILLGAAVLGWLLKHFMSSGKTNELKSTIANWERKHSLLAEESEKNTTKYSATIGQQEKAISDHRNNLLQLEKSLEGLNKEKASLGTQLSQTAADLSSLQQKISGLESSVRSLTGEKEQLNNDWSAKYNGLKAELAAAKEFETKLSVKEEELSKSRKQLADKEGQNLELDLRIKSLSELAGKLPTVEADLAGYKQKLTDAELSYSTRFSELELKEKNSSGNYESKIAGLQSSLNDLKTLADKLPSVEADLKSWKTRYSDLESEQKRLVEENKSLQDKWKAEKDQLIMTGNGETATLKSSLDERNRKITELEHQLSAHATTLESIKSLEAEIGKQKEQNSQLKTASENQSASLRSLEERLKSADSKLSTYANLESDLQGLKNMNSNLEREIGEWKHKWTGAEAKMSMVPATLLMKKDKNDDLKIVEGIGPKIEELLNQEGIVYFEQLADASYVRIRKALDKGGDKFRMHDPGTWGEQADLAARGQWEELKKLQEELDGGRRVIRITKTAKPIKRDDLKVVEGIGPKIEELLNNAGIFSFEQLAHSKADKLKKILEEAGSRFPMHDPTTWPQQAELAAKGKFEELKTLQDKLNAGRK